METGGLVTLACGETLVLTNTLVIATDTILEGSVANATISGAGSVRLFLVRPGVSFTIRRVDLINGRAAPAAAGADLPGEQASGAAIYNEGGRVVLEDVTLSGHIVTGGNGGNGSHGANSRSGSHGRNGGPALGGAIFNEAGDLTAANVVFTANSATGGTGGNGGNGGTSANGGSGGNGGAGGWSAGAALAHSGSGAVLLMNCTFSSNRVSGALAGLGGLSGGVLGLPGSLGIAGGAFGGAVFNRGGAVTILNSTFHENSGVAAAGADATAVPGRGDNGHRGGDGGGAFGGGIFSDAGRIAVTNCTFAAQRLVGGNAGDGGNGSPLGFGGNGGNGGNGGEAAGGGIFIAGGETFVVHSTFGQSSLTGGAAGSGANAGNGITRGGAAGFAGEGLGGALAVRGGTLSVKNSILTGPVAPGAVEGPVIDGGFNLVSDQTLAVATEGTQVGIEIILAALADNGGPTRTMAIAAGSPAAGAIPAGQGCLETDQRGVARSVPCDIGAYEATATVPFASLSFLPGATGITLGWPATIPMYYLEVSTDLLSDWSRVAGAQLQDGAYSITISYSAGTQRFFRLSTGD